MKPKTSFDRVFVMSLLMAVVVSLFGAPVALADGSPLGASPNWYVEGDQSGSGFGTVSQAGDVNGDGYADVVVGANNIGKVFAYHGSPAGLGTTPSWTVTSDQPSSIFGAPVNTAGDVNGDGFDDVIVGARYYNGGQPYEGKAFVYYGSVTGLSTTPDWTAEGDSIYIEFGSTVGTAGDINGDGYDDVLIGAQYYNSRGRAYVYYGSATGLSATPGWTAEGTRWGGRFGGLSSRAGDVNNDGYDDIIIGETADDYGQVLNGRAYVYYGSAGGLGSSANWVVENDQAGSGFGRVGAAGDVNGDGYDDVLVGAYGYDNDYSNSGRVYLYYGSAGGLETSPAWTAEAHQVDTYLGASGLTTAGDVNGDGYSDVLVGAYTFDNGETDEGSVFLYLGSSSGLNAAADWAVESNQAGAQAGNTDTAGDVNGDGYSDILVGAPTYDGSQTDLGRVFAYYGSGSQANLIATISTTEDIYPGDPIPVVFHIQNAHELYAAQAVCAADPDVLRPQEAVFGDFFDPTDRLLGANNPDAASGTWAGAISQRLPASPLSGDGLFATLTYVAHGSGTTSIDCEPLFADQNGFTQPVTFTGVDVIVLPFAVASGTAQYQGRTSHSGMTITAIGPVTVSVQTDSAGNYALNLRTGTYIVVAGGGEYLTQVIDTIDVTSGDSVTLPDVTLQGGDANGDNTIDIGDATLVAANFGLTVPPADARADINADAMVNVQDLAILGGNYGLSGDQP